MVGRLFTSRPIFGQNIFFIVIIISFCQFIKLTEILRGGFHPHPPPNPFSLNQKGSFSYVEPGGCHNAKFDVGCVPKAGNT